MPRPVIRARIEEAGYRGRPVIKDVFFEVRQGEVLLITGRSGCGKTTLLRSVLGIINVLGGYARGYVELLGRALSDLSPGELASLISYIPQEPWLGVIGHTVEADYCHALSVAGKKCVIERLRRYGLGESGDHVTYGLSAGQYQRLLWAEAMDKGSVLLILDEPLAYSDKGFRYVARKIVKEFVERGGAAIIVDHDPGFWRDIAADELRLCPIPRAPSVRRPKQGSGEVVVEVRGAWFRYPGGEWVVRGASLTARRGELLLISGPNGAGKSTLLKLMAGVLRPSRGSVAVSGKPIIVPENPLTYFTHPTVREEILGNEDIAERFGITQLLDKPLAQLSSGERRRAAIASAITRGHDIIVVDEPTAGLDPWSCAAVLNALVGAVEEGHTVIAAAHDKRVAEIATRVCTVDRGAVSCG